MKKIDALKEYNRSSSTHDGHIMPTVETFDTKTKLAIKLWPQIGKNNELNYLFGKGVGVELAIRGNVKGRKKYNNNFSYRCHSDFEIYGAKTTDYSKIPESDAFTYVFGGQELFDKTHTKGLKEIPQDLMPSTYEEVEYNGETFLLPELELLFIDKYLVKENTPRQEGHDAFLLLAEYDLDLDRILYYFDNFYAKPLKENIDQRNNPQNTYEKTIYALETNFIHHIELIFEDEGIEMNLDNINKRVNKSLKFSAKYGPNVGFHGTLCKYCPDVIEYEYKDGKYVLTEETKKACYEASKRAYMDELEKIENIRNDVIRTYNEDQKRKTNKTKKSTI